MKSAWQGVSEGTVSPPQAPEVLQRSTGGVRYRCLPNIVAEPVGELLILIDMDQGTAFRLNSSGKLVWELVQKEKSTAEIVEQMSGMFRVSREKLASDVALV